jgi:hypothetical protein
MTTPKGIESRDRAGAGSWVIRPNGRETGPGLTFPFLVRAMAGMKIVDVVPIEEVTAVTDGWLLSGDGKRFSASAVASRDAAADRWDLSLTVTARDDRLPIDAGIVVAATVQGGSDPGLLIPGLFYGENRPPTSRDRYPRFVRPDGEVGDDAFAAHGWSFRSDRTATPLVCASGRGVRAAVAVTPSSRLGLTGVGFAVDTDGIEISVAFPYREEPVVYDGSSEPLPADLPVEHWEPGRTVRLDLRVYVADVDDDLDRHALRDLAGRFGEGVAPAVLPIGDAAAIAAEGLLRWHDRPREAALIETAAFARDTDDLGAEVDGDRMAMHVGWLSGTPTAAALLIHGLRTADQAAVAAATRVLDAIAAHRAPCGTFWGQWTREDGWTKGWTPGKDALHGRTLAEATLFMIRAAAAFRDDPADAGATADRRARWLDAAMANLRFVVARQLPDGSLPTTWDGQAGEVLAWDGTSPLAWIPALIEGARLAGDPSLVEAGRRAGTRYAGAVEAGALGGAPEDVDLRAPTSEDGYVAVMAYVALLESEPDPAARRRWTELARDAADWALTFRYSYDVAFPPTSPLGLRGFRSRGLDQASPANQHLHTYGLICVPEMARLARHAGDPWYLERTREHLAAARQCLVAVDGDLGAMRGMTPERYYQTRYGGPIGEVGRLSHAWCLGLLLSACEASLDIRELAE